jgi:hypothetical protein
MASTSASLRFPPAGTARRHAATTMTRVAHDGSAPPQPKFLIVSFLHAPTFTWNLDAGILGRDCTKRVRHPCNSDVAALAISLANLARTLQATLAPNDIERALDIRTDFGRVAQAFPLDKALFHDRLNFRETLREVALAEAHQLVIGPPGAGKSWELTRLANELREAGAIVARHHCGR